MSGSRRLWMLCYMEGGEMNMLAISLCVWNHFPLLNLYFWSLAIVCLFCMTETLFLPPFSVFSFYIFLTPLPYFDPIYCNIYIFFSQGKHFILTFLFFFFFFNWALLCPKNCMQCKAVTLSVWLITVKWFQHNLLLNGYIQYHSTAQNSCDVIFYSGCQQFVHPEF